MLYSNKNVQDLQKLNDHELVSLENQVKVLRLQDNLGEQKYHHDRNKLLEPMTDAIENTSLDITKTITETSIKNNKVIENMNEKILDLMNNKSMIAHTIASSLVNIFKPENKSQFRLREDLNSTRMNDFLMNGEIPVRIHDNMLTFRYSNRSFKLDGDLLETMTNYDINVSISNPQDGTLIYDFGKK